MNLRRGFTFLELMLAMVIVAIVAGGVSISLYTAFKARDNIVNSLEPMRQASTAVEFMRRDLESALLPATYLSDTFVGYPAGQSQNGAYADLQFDAAVDGPRGSMQTDVRLIEYTLVDDGNSHDLVRNVISNLLPVQPPALQAQEVLCRRVRSMTITYYDGTQDNNPADWLDTWDSTQTSSNLGGATQTNVLPYAVAVTLQLEPVKADDPPVVVTRVIQLPCAVPASQPAGTTP